MAHTGNNAHNILYHGADGYVASCCHCGRLQVAFGTLVMDLEKGMLTDLLEELERDRDNFHMRVDPRLKVFRYQLMSDDILLVLNHDEVGRLHAMISDALWMHGIYGLAGAPHPDGDQ